MLECEIEGSGLLRTEMGKDLNIVETILEEKFIRKSLLSLVKL